MAGRERNRLTYEPNPNTSNLANGGDYSSGGSTDWSGGGGVGGGSKDLASTTNQILGNQPNVPPYKEDVLNNTAGGGASGEGGTGGGTGGANPPPAADTNTTPNSQGTYQRGRDPALDAKIDRWMNEIDSRYDAGAWAAWAPFENPNCPPNAPFNPDPDHMKWMGVTMTSAESKNYCVEKPVDVPHELSGGAGGGGAGGGGGGGGKGGGGGAGQNKAAAVQERPDYDPTSNYVTQRQLSAGAYGPASAADVGHGASPADPSMGVTEPTRWSPPATTAGGQTRRRSNRQVTQQVPGSTTIPSSVIWTTGM
jgi:hypothetical protein